MNALIKALLAVAIFAAVAFGLLGWHFAYGAKAIEERRIKQLTAGSITELTPEQVAVIAEGTAQPAQLRQMANDPAARKDFLTNVIGEQIVPIFSLAREARINGIGKDPKIEQQLELTRKQVLAQAYDQEQREKTVELTQSQPLAFIKAEDIGAYWQKPGSEKEYAEFLKFVEEQSKATGRPFNLTDEQKEKLRDQWARATVAAERAHEEGLDKKPEIALQIQFQEARLLGLEYANQQTKNLEPTKEEIAAYIKEHPQYDAAKQRERAQEVLQRARAGEDFAKLANEFSDDPGNRDLETGEPKGGLYEKVEKGAMVPEFETAALALEKGGVTDLVESDFGYHIIKLEDKRTEKDKEGKENTVYDVRHILFQTQFQAPQSAPNQFGQPQTLPGEEIARQALSQEKQEKLLADIKARNPIKLPDDFPIDVAKIEEQPEPSLPGRTAPGAPGGGHSPDDGHRH